MNTYWKKNFSWSKSRQGLWEDCPLAYYYTYIARYEYDNEAKKIEPLLKLNKFYFFKGNIIHSAIRSQITQYRLGRPISEEAAKNLLLIEFKKICDNQANYISEAYNGFPWQEDILLKEQADSLSQLENFFKVIWHSYKNLEFVRHEKLEHFFLENIKVWVQPDLVTKNSQGKLIISDWKSGSENKTDPDSDLQLSVYILWASINFGIALDNIAAELVYLKTTQSLPTCRNQQQIDKLKAYVLKQAEIMLGICDKKEFIAKPKFNLCKGCNFSTICPESATK
ncbi:MAG: PD-(D/E)XK nuclease family protein [Candidatus Omnitrophota bacterium]